VRAFLFLSIFFWLQQLAAQLPEKVIGSPIDTSAFAPKSAEGSTQPAVVTEDEKPIVVSDSLGPRKHSPKTATLLSLALPGAGQVYNRKNWWWKVPIIYGGGAALVYGAVFYQKNYKDFQEAYRFKQQYPDQPTGNIRFDKYNDPATLRAFRDSYKEARDQCIIGIGLLYALQVVDAAVEAHFFDFNVGEDLSLNIQPQLGLTGQPYAGLQFTLTIK
jgi:hypothetical protein